MVSDLVHTLFHVTDPHIGPGGGTARDPVDTFDLLDRALHAVEAAAIRPAAVLFTGDLVEHGAPEEYQRLRGLLEPAMARLGAPAVYAAGNHDDRANLRRHLLDEHPTAAPLDAVLRLGDLRIIVLDSTVPGFGYGELAPAQLAWLRSELAEPAPDGTVLALHHPPLPSPAPLASAIELQHREKLAAVISGTDVRVLPGGRGGRAGL